MNYNKFLDFDYVYKGVYLTRLIMFLLMLFGGMVLYSYFTNQNIIDGILVLTGFLFLYLYVKK